MSTIGRQKHMIREVLQDTLQVPNENQRVVRVLGGRGNNLHEVEEAGGERYLVSMPTKFRRNIWIKRGDFILVEPITEGGKVKGEIALIITPEHRKFYQANGCWPNAFESSAESARVQSDDDLFVNTNRPPVYVCSSDSEDSEESDSNTQEE